MPDMPDKREKKEGRREDTAAWHNVESDCVVLAIVMLMDELGTLPHMKTQLTPVKGEMIDNIANQGNSNEGRSERRANGPSREMKRGSKERHRSMCFRAMFVVVPMTYRHLFGGRQHL
jgi:hypothetical protein